MTKPNKPSRLNFDLDVPAAAAPVVVEEQKKPTVEPIKKPSKVARATPQQKALYHKSLTVMLTKAQYVDFRNCLALEDRIGQETLADLVEKWCARVKKKHAKGLSSEESLDD